MLTLCCLLLCSGVRCNVSVCCMYRCVSWSDALCCLVRCVNTPCCGAFCCLLRFVGDVRVCYGLYVVYCMQYVAYGVC